MPKENNRKDMTENKPNGEREKAAQMVREPQESMDSRQNSRDRKLRSKNTNTNKNNLGKYQFEGMKDSKDKNKTGQNQSCVVSGWVLG